MKLVLAKNEPEMNILIKIMVITVFSAMLLRILEEACCALCQLVNFLSQNKILLFKMLLNYMLYVRRCNDGSI